MTSTLWAIWLAVTIATATVVGVASFRAGQTLVQGKWDASVLAGKAGEDRALKAAAKAISKIEVRSEQLVQPVRTEIRTNTVYRDCKHSDDSLRNLNALIDGAEPAGGSSVPEAKSPD